MTPNDNDFEKVWDEHRWEEYLKAFENESARLRQFINATWGESQPAWERLMSEFATKTEVVDAYVEEELMYEESAFPDDDDDFGDDDEDEFEDDYFLKNSGGRFRFLDNEDEDDEDDEEAFDAMDFLADALEEAGEEASEDASAGATNSDENANDILDEDPDMVLYNRARAIGAEILAWREQYGETRPPLEVAAFITDSLQIAAKLAASYWFGYDMETLGANIAYTKKALHLNNAALERLRQLYLSGLVSKTTYHDFTEKLQDLRNDLGVNIQEMRDMFHNGF
jgi:hypothetical protein